MHVDLYTIVMQLAFDAWVCWMVLTWEHRISQDLIDGYNECRKYTQQLKDRFDAHLKDQAEFNDKTTKVLDELHQLFVITDMRLNSHAQAIADNLEKPRQKTRS